MKNPPYCVDCYTERDITDRQASFIVDGKSVCARHLISSQFKPLHEAGLLDELDAADSTGVASEPLTREDIERAKHAGH